MAFLGGTLLAHSPPPQALSPEPVTSDPAPALPAPAVLAALVAHARKVAADHHTRTGQAIDTPTLRARLGVTAPLAEAVAAQL